jgi:hypothetical protein
MCDEPGVEEIADLGGVAAASVLVVIGDGVTQFGGVARLGRGLDVRDESANLFLGRAAWAAAGKSEQNPERERRLSQGNPPIAGRRR